MKQLLIVSLLVLPCLARAQSVQNNADSIAKGKALYMTSCLACHGEKGDGAGPAAVALPVKPRNFSAAAGFQNGSAPAKIVKTLTDGMMKNGTPTMPSFASAITAEQQWELAYYIQTFIKN